MSSDLPSPRTILFTIPAEAVARYRAWKAQADQIYLNQELARRGRAVVMRFKGEDEAPDFDDITALSELGDAEAVYGTVGGGYPFEFRPHRTGCTLTVTAPVEVEPFQLELLAPQVLDKVVPTPARNGILDHMPREAGADWRFGITGPSFKQLLDWGWDAAVPGAYSYKFIPTNIGCPIFITHEASGRQLDLGMEDFM